jgi:short-subunit dehydrogenase
VADRGVGVSIVEPSFVREAGMFANAKAKLPPGVRTVSPEDVADGVVKAIRRDRAEVVVAPAELRVGAALTASVPEFNARVQKVSGAVKVSNALAEGQRNNR